MDTATETLLEKVRSAIQAGGGQALADVLADVRPADIAEVYQVLDDEERSTLIYSIPPRLVAEVIVLLDDANRGEVVEEMDEGSLTQMVQELAPDDAADVLAEMPEEQREEVLEQIPDLQADQLEELMQFPEDTAGGIMTPEFIALPTTATVGDTVSHIQEASLQEDLHEVYVVDEMGRLEGVIPLRRLVTSGRGTRLGDICIREPISVRTDADQEQVSQVFSKYSLTAVPVVDHDRRLVGKITYDDVMDVVQEEAAEDLYRMAGTDAAELETASVAHAARVRLAWLLPCLLGTCVTASVIIAFQSKNQEPLGAAQIGILLCFVPMIGAMGGNSGIQTSTIIVRGFATGDFAVRSLNRAFAREIRVAGLVALGCGLTAGIVSFLFVTVRELFVEKVAVTNLAAMELRYLETGTAVGLGMFCAILSATLLGVLLPFGFRRFGVDPAIASGPIITTVNDFVSVSMYLFIAVLVLR